jgi:hypothetical protein
MEEVEKVVAESAPEIETQTDVNVESQSPEVTGSSTEPANTIADQMTEKEVDERGVPYKNRFHEMERKYNQVVENIPQIIQQTLTKTINQNQTQQTQNYSIVNGRIAIQNPDYRMG